MTWKKALTAVKIGLIGGIAISLLTFAAALQAEELGKVNVNTASSEELDFLPGVGPKTAANITYAREQGEVFTKCEDLEKVSGIGPKKREKMCPYIVFEGETTLTNPVGESAATTKYKRPDLDPEA